MEASSSGPGCFVNRFYPLGASVALENPNKG
jgi:hypothetical protein